MAALARRQYLGGGHKIGGLADQCPVEQDFLIVPPRPLVSCKCHRRIRGEEGFLHLGRDQRGDYAAALQDVFRGIH